VSALEWPEEPDDELDEDPTPRQEPKLTDLEATLADPDLEGLWGGTNDRERRELSQRVA